MVISESNRNRKCQSRIRELERTLDEIAELCDVRRHNLLTHFRAKEDGGAYNNQVAILEKARAACGHDVFLGFMPHNGP